MLCFSLWWMWRSLRACAGQASAQNPRRPWLKSHSEMSASQNKGGGGGGDIQCYSEQPTGHEASFQTEYTERIKPLWYKRETRKRDRVENGEETACGTEVTSNLRLNQEHPVGEDERDEYGETGRGILWKLMHEVGSEGLMGMSEEMAKSWVTWGEREMEMEARELKKSGWEEEAWVIKVERKRGKIDGWKVRLVDTLEREWEGSPVCHTGGERGRPADTRPLYLTPHIDTAKITSALQGSISA